MTKQAAESAGGVRIPQRIVAGDLAGWLAQSMRTRDVSLRTVARQTGLSHTTVHRLLKGDRDPTLATALALVRYFEGRTNSPADELRRITRTRVPFGKYRGWSLKDVADRDPNYLTWLLGHSQAAFHADVAAALVARRGPGGVQDRDSPLPVHALERERAALVELDSRAGDEVADR